MDLFGAVWSCGGGMFPVDDIFSFALGTVCKLMASDVTDLQITSRAFLTSFLKMGLLVIMSWIAFFYFFYFTSEHVVEKKSWKVVIRKHLHHMTSLYITARFISRALVPEWTWRVKTDPNTKRFWQLWKLYVWYVETLCLICCV